MLGEGYHEFGEWLYQRPRLGACPFTKNQRWSPWEKPGKVIVWNIEGNGDYFQHIRYAAQDGARRLDRAPSASSGSIASWRAFPESRK